MADKGVLELAEIDTISSDCFLYIVDGNGNSRKVNVDDLAQYISTAASIVPASEPFRGCIVRRSTDLTGLTWPVIVPWDSEELDTEGMWDAGDPTKIVIPAGVTKVEVTASIAFNATAVSGSTRVRIRKNGTGTDSAGAVTSCATHARQGTTGFTDNTAHAFSAVLSVEENDYLDVRVNSSNTSLTSILSGAFTFFQCKVIERNPS